MADYGTLFSLVLVALTCVLVGMCFIVYIMVLEERQRRMLRTSESSSVEGIPEGECPRYFGYLSDYPMNAPVPDECFGCPRACECKNVEPEASTIEIAKPS